MDYDELAAEYAAHRTVHPEVLRRLVETGRIDAGAKVLEVGCGTGNYAAVLVKATGCRCWGVDPCHFPSRGSRLPDGSVDATAVPRSRPPEVAANRWH